MRAIRSFFIAFSIYSRIPVPQFAWEEEDMKYTFCFFPWVGALIGVCLCFWNDLCGVYQIGALCRVMTDAAIPLFLTGGFHVDGFLDTMDALHSYSAKERKLEILRDSHIGAFAVIMFALYGLVFLAALSELESDALFRIVCAGFFLSRCLSGIGALTFPLAKKDGMLCRFADGSHKKIVKGSLYLQGAACIGLMLFWSLPGGLAVTAAALLSLAYYFYRSRKEFGGITGDTAGYFVLLCECCMTAAAACVDIFV
ncbi:MAG: adenosylcobinamide-GDP ribazoletransferase [Blautia sp.]|nr:adenosylcobinamide-GDP ribazoletransferase [Blautia sp.]MCM1202135.1 adenosylcobinamide-GDP ribazoletransferase [Bacteroides fragilis]